MILILCTLQYETVIKRIKWYFLYYYYYTCLIILATLLGLNLILIFLGLPDLVWMFLKLISLIFESDFTYLYILGGKFSFQILAPVEIFFHEQQYNWFKNLCMVDLTTPKLIFFSSVLFFATSWLSLFLMSFLGLYGAFLFNLLSLSLFFVSSLLNFFNFFDGLVLQVIYGQWFFALSNTTITLSFYLDLIAFAFMLLTISIAFFVNIFTFSYFRYEPLVDRLLIYLNLFVISMVILVTAGNLFILFLGWELIGLTSFLLINFWVTRVGTLKAAFKAFSFNKFSDMHLLLGVILLYHMGLDTNIAVLTMQLPFYGTHTINLCGFTFLYLDIISLLFISAAFVKSAQFGAHIWLPDSMEAPVPASALIHSATLVSAGIFLMLRLNKLFELSTLSFFLVSFVGALTAFVGGFVAAFQSDVKRTLAYSTISHCGFLMVISTFFLPEYTLVYLYVHGYFKAAVFLCVGNVIRFSRNYQDFRRMGSFYKYLPFECFASFICLLNLGGLPFTYGFFIKHYLFVTFNTLNVFWLFTFCNIFLASFTGIFYSYRLFYYVFFDFKKARKTIYLQANRVTLKSKFFSNSTRASQFSIASLIIVAYSVIFLWFLCIKPTNFADLIKFFDVNTFFYILQPNNSFLFNFFFSSWIIVFFYGTVVCLRWRFLITEYVTFTICSTILFFFIFFWFWF